MTFLQELQSSRIFVAGHRGLVGSALVRKLRAIGCEKLLLQTSAELDLREQGAVRAFFEKEKPDVVLLAAAQVGGIHANNTFRAQFIYDNLMIAGNVIEASYRNGVKRFLNLGSSCIYPKLATQPLKEEYLLTGALEQTNEPYAVAKIAALKLVENYNRQYGTNYLSAMPTNLYGPYDNFDLETSHVIPAMIRKCHEAKVAGARSVTMWGTGEVYREFLYSEDLTDACLLLLEKMRAGQYPGDFVNIGVGRDLTVKELAHLVRDVVGFQGDIVWDQAKPSGTPKKLLDSSLIQRLGWRPKVDLREGITRAYQWFVENK